MADPDTNTNPWRDKVEARFLKLEGKWNWRRLALETGISESQFSRWKNQGGKPSLDEFTAMARALRVPIAYLVDEDAPPPGMPNTPEEELLLNLAREIGVPVILRIIAAAAARETEPKPAPASVPASQHEHEPTEIKSVVRQLMPPTEAVKPARNKPS